MLPYLLRRSAFLVISLVVAMIVIFVLLRLLPGDPANALLSIDATPEQIAAARAQVGSDQPLLQQFATWSAQLLSGDLGDSYISTRPVGPEVAGRLGVTLPLALLSFVIALVLALAIGITAAVKADRWYGIVLSGFSQLGVAVPVFWVGVIVVWVFALQLGLLPSGGFPRDDWEDPADALRSLALPVHDDRDRDERLDQPLCALGDPRRAGQRLPAHGPRRRRRSHRGPAAPRRAQRLGARHRRSSASSCRRRCSAPSSSRASSRSPGSAACC